LRSPLLVMVPQPVAAEPAPHTCGVRCCQQAAMAMQPLVSVAARNSRHVDGSFRLISGTLMSAADTLLCAATLSRAASAASLHLIEKPAVWRRHQSSTRPKSRRNAVRRTSQENLRSRVDASSCVILVRFCCAKQEGE
jgi:hypothetical protein